MIFYRSFYEAIQNLDCSDQCAIYNAIFQYGLNFQEPELTGVPLSFWKLIKPQIDANIKRYENGKKPKTKQIKSKTEAKQKQSESKSGTNVNVNDNVNDNEKENNTSKFDFDALLIHFNNTFNKRSRIIPEKVKKSYLARLKEGYTSDDIHSAMKNASLDKWHRENQFHHCTLEFFSRAEKIDKFASATLKQNSPKYIPTT